MKKIIACICWALLLSACAGDAQTKATSSLAIACETMASTLDQLTPRKAGMAQGTIGIVNRAKSATDPLCLPNSPFDPATATATVQNAINIIKGL